MKIDPYRLLSFAFASADLFIEVDSDGIMGFALGAGTKVCGRTEAELAGRAWRDVIAPADQPMIEAFMTSLGPAERRGPVNVRILHPSGGEHFASLSFGRLPPLKTISMAFSLFKPEGPASKAGLLNADEFTTEAEKVIARARNSGSQLGLSLVEMSGLSAAKQAMTPDDASRLEDKIAGAMRAQAYAGALVGRLGPESYALVRPEGDSEDQLTARLSLSLKSMIDDMCDICAVVQPFSLPGTASPGHSVLAMKRAMDAVARDGAPEGQSLAEAVSHSIEKTLAEAAKFRAAVSARQFRLAYQPVVSLKTELLHHYEVLVRFGDGKSPMDTILMAEELALIEQLDLAILDEALKAINAPRSKLKLAINISGRSISDPAFVTRLRKAAARSKRAPDSLIFEITESSRIEDFDAVDGHIQTLRRDGHTVCLDDFGAGAASLAYLQRLQIDVVKIDGQYIRTLTEERETAMIRHVVGMCRDLGVATIAEMVETEALAEASRLAGVDYAQGYLFGRPAAKPEAVKPRSGPVAARRVGVVERWG